MKRSSITVLLLACACVGQQTSAAEPAQPPRSLEFRTISLNGEKGGMLAVVDGQPRLVNSRTAWTEWTLRETDKGWTIQGGLGLFGERTDPRFLSVDAKGKVTLVAELGDGAYWKLTRKGTGHSFDATIQASGGKLDGWYLGFLDKQEQIERGNNQVQILPPGTVGEARPQDEPTHLYRRAVKVPMLSLSIATEFKAKIPAVVVG